MKFKTKNLILNVLAILIAIFFLFPLYWIIITSFKTETEIFQLHPTLFPHDFTTDAYVSQFAGGDYNLLKGFFNSIVVAIPTMIISVILSVPAAYGLAVFELRGKHAMIQSFLLTQLMPATLLLAPMFIIFKSMGFINTYMAPILANCVTAIPFSVMILRPFFLKLPKDLEDSAKIDGCNTFTAFTKIMIPVSFPGIIMIAAFSFLYGWGDLVYSLTFISKGSMRPITAGIYNYIGKYGIQWDKIMAFGTVVVIPVVLIFIFLQKYIIGGLTNGAVKE